MFVSLAFPTAEEPGPTFAIIFLVRVVENLAYLFFQLNIWFKFRIWIKGKFKKDQVRTSCKHMYPRIASCSAHDQAHQHHHRRLGTDGLGVAALLHSRQQNLGKHVARRTCVTSPKWIVL